MTKQSQNSDRRQFLKTVSLGAGALVLSGIGLERFSRQKGKTVFNHARPMLGTFVHITIHHDDAIVAERAMTAAFSAIDRVDQLMSIHRSDSQLSEVNKQAGQSMVAVDGDFFDIIDTANQMSETTNGVYDISCLPLMKLYGYYQSNATSKYPTDREIASILDVVGHNLITADRTLGKVGLSKVGAAIDLGSIGKGFAVDQAVIALKANGIESALINAGGNIYAMGTPDHSSTGWHVAIRNPLGESNNPYYETLELSNQAVATSGNYENHIQIGKSEIGHIFNMISGKPSTSGVSTTVVSTSATMADALSTSAFILGPAKESLIANQATSIYYHGFKG